MITVQDLSHMLPGGPASALVPTSQHAGNTSAENSAMTAPGIPSEVVVAADVHPAPTVEAIDHSRTVLTSADQGPDPAPWTQADGTQWRRAVDSATPLPETAHLPRIRLGQWNEL